MFRIEINPGHINQHSTRTLSSQSQSQSHSQSQSQSLPSQPKPPLYACIQTSAHNDNFVYSSTTDEHVEDKSGTIILTIGRKDCDVNFERDKSVSRKHCVIKIFSSSKRKDNSESINEACNDADNGIVVMIQELKSRFGTFMYVGNNKNDKDDKKGDKDENTDDDATDDEDNDLSNFSEVNDEKPVKKKIESGCKMILPQLSHPFYEQQQSESNINNNNQNNNNKHNNVGEITVEFGVSGSHIRIRRIPLVFSFSRVPKAVQSSLSTASRLQSIGAVVSTNWDSCRSTHLVCSERLSTAKNVSAWACRKAMVTPDYVHALLSRNHPSDALPREEDFVPGGTVPMDNIDPSLPRKVLSKYPPFLSFLPDEMEQLARAGGATIVALYDIPDKEFYQEDVLLSFLPTPSIKKQPISWILLDNNSRKVKKRKTSLLSHLKDKLCLTNATELAISISHLQSLHDIDSNTIPFDENLVITPEVIIPPTPQEEESQNTVHNTHSQPLPPQQQNDIVEITASQPPTQYADAMNVEPSPPQQPQEQHEDTSALQEQYEDASPLQEQQQQQSQEDMLPLQEQNDPMQQHLTTISTKKLRHLSEESGWLTTNSNNPPPRQDDPDNPIPESACSIYQSDLIHISDQQQQQHNQSHLHNTSLLQNFKKFRKNRVLYSHHSNNTNNTNNFPELQSLLPKETLRQQELHLSQIEKERKNHYADMLFQDDAVSTTSKRKTRNNAGGTNTSTMHSYFSPSSSSTTKRRRLVS